MNTNLFKTTVAALALMVAFNSCKKEENEFPDSIKLLVADDTVFTSINDLQSTSFFNGNAILYIAATPDYNGKSVSITTKKHINNIQEDFGIKPYTKYYWYLQASNYDNSYSKIRSFYYIPALEIDIHNVEGDWAAVMNWENSETFEDVQVTLTPDKNCKYDKNPITIPAGQDSCYISAGSLGNQKYQIYHNWWDEANGKYYEPVVYDFNLTVNCNIDGRIFPISATKKGIFLNTDGYAADSDFNVYRYEKIGNKIWMLDDLRMKLDNKNLYYTVRLESGLEMVLYADYSDINKENAEKMIPKGFHLATHEDWLDLEAHFGLVEEKDTKSLSFAIWSLNLFHYIANSDDICKYDYVLDYDLFDYTNIYDYYSGEGSGIRYYLIADNEWYDFNDATKKLNGSHIFDAHPCGIPYVSDYEKMTVDNPYKGYGVAFCTSSYGNISDWCIKRILWSGSDGICRIKSSHHDGYRDMTYSLWRCVKDK